MKKKKTKNIFKKSLVMGLSLLSVLSSFSNFATAVYAEGETDTPVETDEPVASPQTEENGDPVDGGEEPEDTPTPTPTATPETTPDGESGEGKDDKEDGKDGEDAGEKKEETKYTISSVALSMSSPMLNEELSKDVTVVGEYGDYVSIGNVAYYIGETAVSETVAQELTAYTVAIDLGLSEKAVADNVTFDATMGATVNDDVASITPSSDGTSANVKYTFSKTAEDPNSAIKLNLTIAEPVLLELPSTAVNNESSDVQVSTVTWYQDGKELDTRIAFQRDHDYSLEIKLTSTNKKFVESESVITINGEEATLSIIDEHTAIAHIDFGQCELFETVITPKEITDTVVDTGLGLVLHDYFDWPQTYGSELYTLDKEATTAEVSFLSSGKLFVIKPGTVKFSVTTEEIDNYKAGSAEISFEVDKTDDQQFTRASAAGTASNALELYPKNDYTSEDDAYYVYNKSGNMILVGNILQAKGKGVTSEDGVIRVWWPKAGTFFGEEVGAEVVFTCEVKSGHDVSSNADDKYFAIDFMDNMDEGLPENKTYNDNAYGPFNTMSIAGRRVRIDVTFYKNVDKSLIDVNGTAVNLETNALHLFYGPYGISNESAHSNQFEWTAADDDGTIVYLADAMPEQYAASTEYLGRKIYYSTDTRLNAAGTNPLTNADYLYDGKGKTTVTYYVGHTGADYTTWTFNPDGSIKSTDGDNSIWFSTHFKHITNVTSGMYYLEIDPNGGIYEDKTGEGKAYQRNSETTSGNPNNWFIEDFAYEKDGISIPTREGYSFDGWEIVKGPGTLNEDQSEYTFGEGNGKIVAKWRHYAIFTEVVNGSITGDNDGNMVTETGSVTEILAGEDRTIKYEPKDEYHYLSYIEVSSRNADGTWNDPEKVSVEEFTSQYDFTDINCDYKIKVVYEPAKLTIHYVEKDTNVTMWQDAHILTKGKGDAYSVESPAIQGYTIYADGESQKVVAGIMPDNTYEVTVYYEKDAMIGSDVTLYVNAEPYSGTQVTKGGEITYKVTAQNTGVQGAQDASFTIVIPEGTTFKEIGTKTNENITVSYDEQTRTITGTFPQVTRGQGQQFSYTVTVNQDDKFHDEDFTSPIYQMATWHTDKDSTERESNLVINYLDETVKGPASLFVQKASTTLIKREVIVTYKYDISGSATNTLSNGRGADHPTNVKMGSFTAPEDGTYHFEIVGHSATKNGQSGWGTYYGATVEFDLELKAGDTIYGLAGWGRSQQMDNKISRVLGGGGGNGEKGGGANGYNGTGGGASFIATSNLGEIQNYYSNSTNKSTIIAIASGAGIEGSALGFAALGNSPQAGEQGGGGATGGSSKKPGTSYQAGTITINGRSVALQNVTFSNRSLNGDAHIYVYHTTTETYYESEGNISGEGSSTGGSGSSTVQGGGSLNGSISVEQGVYIVADPTNYVNATSYTAPKNGTYHVQLQGGYTASADGNYIRYGARVEFDIQLAAGDTLYGLGGYHTWLGKNGTINRTVNGGGGGTSSQLAGSGATVVTVKKIGNGELNNYSDSKEYIVAVAGGAGANGEGQGVLSGGTFCQGTTGSGGGYYGGTNGNGGSSYVASSATINGHLAKISNVSITAGGRENRNTGAHESGNSRNYYGYGAGITYVEGSESSYDNDFITATDMSNGIINYTRTSATSGSKTTNTNTDTTITYSITFKNDGATDANNVVLRDVIPAGTDYVDGSLTVECTNDSAKNNFTISYDKDNNMIYVYGTKLARGNIFTLTFKAAVNGESSLIRNQVDFDRDIKSSEGKTATLKHKSNIVEHKLKGKIVVTKDWVDDEESDRPASITAHLVGSDGTNLTASLTAANNWTYTFDVNYSKGVTYYVYEDEVDLYESNATASNPIVVGEYNSATLRNTYMPNFNVSKDVKNANGVSIDGEYVKVNDELTYEITISNPTSKTKYYDVEDVVPTNTTYKSGGTSYDANTRTVTFSNVAVEANSSATVSFKVTVNSDAKKATIVNKANVWLLRSNGTRVEKRKQETNEVTNYTTYDNQFVKDVTTLDGDSIDKTYLNAGDTYYYTIKVENFAKEAKDFTITDKLPEEVTFVEADNNGTHANGTVTWKVNVASGKSATVKVKVRVNDDVKNALIENIANVTVDHVDQDTNKVENRSGRIIIEKVITLADKKDVPFLFNIVGSDGNTYTKSVIVKAGDTTAQVEFDLPSYKGYGQTYTISESDPNMYEYVLNSAKDVTSTVGVTLNVDEATYVTDITANKDNVVIKLNGTKLFAAVQFENERTRPHDQGDTVVNSVTLK